MAIRIKTGGLMEFVHTDSYKKLSKKKQKEVREAYKKAELRKKREAREHKALKKKIRNGTGIRLPIIASR